MSRHQITIEISDDLALGWALYLLGQKQPDPEDEPEAAEGWATARTSGALNGVRTVFLPEHQDPDDPGFIINVNVTVNDQNVVAVGGKTKAAPVE